MERLKERLVIARQALQTLREALASDEPTVIGRDAAILRFAYSFEACWKAAQMFLKEIQGLEAGSPKAIIRASREAGILNDSNTELALAMADDRNLTVHTYNEALALTLFGRLPSHYTLLDQWLLAMQKQVDHLD